MIDFKTLLSEARTAPLYHAIPLEHFFKAMAENRIVARGKHIHPGKTEWNHAEKERNLLPGTSTTRNFQYAKLWGIENNRRFVVIEFDQLALASNNKIIPLNYIVNANTAYRIASPFYAWKGPLRYPTRQMQAYGPLSKTNDSSEFEEYVVGDIKNLDSKISKIHVFNQRDLEALDETPLDGDPRIVTHF